MWGMRCEVGTFHKDLLEWQRDREKGEASRMRTEGNACLGWNFCMIWSCSSRSFYACLWASNIYLTFLERTLWYISHSWSSGLGTSITNGISITDLVHSGLTEEVSNRLRKFPSFVGSWFPLPWEEVSPFPPIFKRGKNWRLELFAKGGGQVNMQLWWALSSLLTSMRRNKIFNLPRVPWQQMNLKDATVS